MVTSSLVILMYLFETVYMQRYVGNFLVSLSTQLYIWDWRHFLIGSVGDRRLRWRRDVRESKRFIYSDNLYLLPAFSRSRPPTLSTYPCCVPHSTYLCSRNWNSNNAEFLAFIKSKYVNIGSFYHAFTVVLIFHGSYFDGSLTTEQLTEISLAYPDDITKVTFNIAYCFWKDLINLYDVSLGVSFWHRNLERCNVSYTGLHSNLKWLT